MLIMERGKMYTQTKFHYFDSIGIWMVIIDVFYIATGFINLFQGVWLMWSWQEQPLQFRVIKSPVNPTIYHEKWSWQVFIFCFLLSLRNIFEAILTSITIYVWSKSKENILNYHLTNSFWTCKSMKYCIILFT